MKSCDMKKDFGAVFRILKRLYKEPSASSMSTPWEVLLFTLLSARTRDEQAEIAFRRLIKEFPNPKDIAVVGRKDIERLINTIGFYRNKAAHIKGLAKAVIEKYKGRVPETMDELIALPGVGRKTASCVLIYAYNRPAIAVDTHVHRITNRLGWVGEKTPELTEEELRKVLPKKYWVTINRVMVHFGRDICVPRTPRCWKCPIRKHCGYKNKSKKA